VTEATAERLTEPGGPHAPRRDHERSLTSEEKRVVAVLGVPTLSLALATTVVTTYLPVVAQEFVGSTVVIGLIVGLEGLVGCGCRSSWGRGRIGCGRASAGAFRS
jgi:uncharacterized ion transporter superfamily protein YfcC